ncbi:hypothetical protein CR105_08170 [Massilia eurypsychrophila]|uniref:Uncharacterized protein n=1 Tax=Massilia eurypsychrophila TaxID=1485217 RepID=A0A2G8TGI7_9BURK|nr:hypothetical protein CR105_08170 [Massilia eurypsychrophila]
MDAISAVEYSAPQYAARDEIGHIVFLRGVPQSACLFLAHRSADIGLRDHWDERLDGTVGRRTNAARTAVSLLDCRRQLL